MLTLTTNLDKHKQFVLDTLYICIPENNLTSKYQLWPHNLMAVEANEFYVIKYKFDAIETLLYHSMMVSGNVYGNKVCL